MTPKNQLGAAGRIPTSIRGYRWWYVVVTVPIVQTLWTLSFGIVFLSSIYPIGDYSVNGFDVATVVLVLLFFPTIVVTFVLPIALYRDITLLDEHDTGRWTPDRDQYVIAAIAGIVVPGVSIAISIYYLHRRHAYLGIP